METMLNVSDSHVTRDIVVEQCPSSTANDDPEASSIVPTVAGAGAENLEHGERLNRLQTESSSTEKVPESLHAPAVELLPSVDAAQTINTQSSSTTVPSIIIMETNAISQNAVVVSSEASLTNSAAGQNEVVIVNKAPEQLPCLFCHETKSDILKYGEFIRYSDTSKFHYKCLLTASGLIQRYDVQKAPIGLDEENVVNCRSDEDLQKLGFCMKDILKECNRAKKLTCRRCKKGGACNGCSNNRCEASFHLPCAIEDGCFVLYSKCYPTYCAAHVQDGIKKYALTFPGSSAELRGKRCMLCYEDLSAQYKRARRFDFLQPTCCRREDGVWFLHRQCAEKQVHVAGQKYAKCPNCNQNQPYIQYLEQAGVFVLRKHPDYLFDFDDSSDDEEFEEIPSSLLRPLEPTITISGSGAANAATEEPPGDTVTISAALITSVVNAVISHPAVPTPRQPQPNSENALARMQTEECDNLDGHESPEDEAHEVEDVDDDYCMSPFTRRFRQRRSNRLAQRSPSPPRNSKRAKLSSQKRELRQSTLNRCEAAKGGFQRIHIAENSMEGDDVIHSDTSATISTSSGDFDDDDDANHNSFMATSPRLVARRRSVSTGRRVLRARRSAIKYFDNGSAEPLSPARNVIAPVTGDFSSSSNSSYDSTAAADRQRKRSKNRNDGKYRRRSRRLVEAAQAELQTRSDYRRLMQRRRMLPKHSKLPPTSSVMFDDDSADIDAGVAERSTRSAARLANFKLNNMINYERTHNDDDDDTDDGSCKMIEHALPVRNISRHHYLRSTKNDEDAEENSRTEIVDADLKLQLQRTSSTRNGAITAPRKNLAEADEGACKRVLRPRLPPHAVVKQLQPHQHHHRYNTRHHDSPVKYVADEDDHQDEEDYEEKGDCNDDDTGGTNNNSPVQQVYVSSNGDGTLTYRTANFVIEETFES